VLLQPLDLGQQTTKAGTIQRASFCIRNFKQSEKKHQRRYLAGELWSLRAALRLRCENVRVNGVLQTEDRLN
jgi:hypothetical protein